MLPLPYAYTAVLDEPDLFRGEAAANTVDGWTRLDNITPSALLAYRSAFGEEVTADDVFYYAYGILHAPEYRKAFAADLKKTLPRIPQVSAKADFAAFLEAGQSLSKLHLGYETVKPYPLAEQLTGAPDAAAYRVGKMLFGKIGKDVDSSVIIYNSRLRLSGIPAEVYEYQLGSRSAIGWVMERHQIKTDKASGIVNDPNDWAEEVGDPRYIVDLVKRIVTVSLETVKIVRALPPLHV